MSTKKKEPIGEMILVKKEKPTDIQTRMETGKIEIMKVVEGISGDYYNVMGLPVCRLARMLARFGVDSLALAAEKEQRA